jgi:hypothetical protein
MVFDNQSGLLVNCGDDPTREILSNLEAVSFCDLNQERNTRWISDEGRQAATVL